MKTIIFISLYGIIGCTVKPVIPFSTKTYNLNGNVKFYSEKKVTATYDSLWNIKVDSAQQSTVAFTNRIFDKSGWLTSTDFFDKDSAIIIQRKYLYRTSGSYIGTDEYDKKGNLSKKIKVVKSSADILVTETHDAISDKLLSKSTTEFKNELIVRLADEGINNNKLEWVYTREKDGLEVEMQFKLSLDNNVQTTLTKFKYLEFDKFGNWIKRIEYSPKNENKCTVIYRRITYYQ